MMRALTLTQPWAGLVASGIKLVENRPRRMIKAADAGTRFAIHASREVKRETWRQIIDLDPRCALDNPGPMRFACDVHRLGSITSAVIAVATLDTCIERSEEDDGYGVAQWERSKGWPDPSLRNDGAMPLQQLKWFFGPVGYVLRDVVALPEPVPCKGALGFWRLPTDVERAVRGQLGERVE